MRNMALSGWALAAATLAFLATAAPASAQSTPSPDVKKLIETRLGTFEQLAKEIEDAGEDEAKLAELAKKVGAAAEQTYSDYQELNDTWNADQKSLVETYARDAGQDIMKRLVTAAKKADAALPAGASGCSECVAMVLVPACQVRCCKGDQSPPGSAVALEAWSCPPVEKKDTCTARPGCPS